MKIQKSIIILIMSKANLRLPPRVILERSEESRGGKELKFCLGYIINICSRYN